jgi:hypothetical protein
LGAFDGEATACLGDQAFLTDVKTDPADGSVEDTSWGPPDADALALVPE